MMNRAITKISSWGALDCMQQMDAFVAEMSQVSISRYHTPNMLNVKEYQAASPLASVKPWSWDDSIPGGDSLSPVQRRKIKEFAMSKGYIPEIEISKADGMRYGFANFVDAGVVQRTVYLPKTFWKLSDKEQFNWLDKHIGGTRKGMT